MSHPVPVPATAGRPSDVRRKALNEELSVPLVSNFFPLERYYDAADKVYQSFINAYQDGLRDDGALDDAFVYGKRYCLFCTEAIPTHNYYKTVRYKSEQQKHTQQVSKVIPMLEDVAKRMDKNEAEKQRIAKERAQKQEQERLQRLQHSLDKWQRQQQQQQQYQSSVSKRNGTIEASALSKLELLRPPSAAPKPGRQQNNNADDLRIRRDPSGEEPTEAERPMSTSTSTSRYRLVEDDSDDDNQLPPPVPPPSANGGSSASAPPSYDQVVQQRKHSREFFGPASAINGPTSSLEGAPFRFSASHLTPLPIESGASIGSAAPNGDIAAHKRKQPRVNLPMSELQRQYLREYENLIHRKQIQVWTLETYQGRVSSSTNGCTVISALCAATHLQTRGGITDAQICQIMDRTCGPYLREIRNKLGLGGHALIIPSDVHDYLVDCKLLDQSSFVGAAGGNIMDLDHLEEFIQLLVRGTDNPKKDTPHVGKAAATLFFREHVISLVKMVQATSPNGNHNGTECCYDLIDSLPSSGGGATRTRCYSVDALRALLLWYASRKLSMSDCNYVDRNRWNDRMADLDPRVFQGFVWAEPIPQ